MLLATDAAGEGINLQRAHLMVNYDLPWNPNRLEQRFGRIHRIGQTEVCHLWNLVAEETREGDVYRTLLEKLEEARQALGGQVFDVLGKLQFEGKPLRDLLIEAIRYGEQPEVRARLTTVVEHALDRDQLQDLLEERALAHDAMDASRVQRIREEMERAEARRLQPHYIESFFLEAFKRLGGTVRAARAAPLRGHPRPGAGAQPRPADRHRRAGAAALRAHRLREGAGRAARASRWPPSSAPATRCSTRPSTSRSSATATCCKRGAVLVDERDPGTEPAGALLPRARHPGRRASPAPASGASSPSGCSTSRWTPTATRATCTTRPTSTTGRWQTDEPGVDAILDRPECAWISRELEQKAQGHAIAHVVPEHLAEVRGRRLELDRQDRGGGQGPADQGDHLLGPPRRAAQAPGAGRQAQRPAQLAGGPQARRRPAGAAAEAPGGAGARSADLAAAAGGAGWARWSCRWA